MISGSPADSITPDQAPPLWIPLSFFFTAPFFLLVAGLIIYEYSSFIFVSNWLPLTLAVVHLGILGFVVMVMLGALYQMVPVVVGRPVSAIGLAHVVHILFTAGVICLVLGLSMMLKHVLAAAVLLLAAATLIFAVPILIAVFTARAKHDSVIGIRFAVMSFLLTVVLGCVLAGGYLGYPYPGLKVAWVQTHLTLGLLGWVGGLILAVSWQVVPMFYLTPFYSTKVTRVMLGLLFLGFVVTISGWGYSIFSGKLWLLHVGSLTYGLTVWLFHPAYTLYLLANRRRQNKDGSFVFWKWGMACAILALMYAVEGSFKEDPKWLVLFGWLAIIGWAGLIVHGMLCRIVPFLVWFHRYSLLVGRVPVPSMKKLLPEKRVFIALYLHLGALLAGSVAIIHKSPHFTKLTGLLLMLTAVALTVNILGVALYRPVKKLEVESDIGSTVASDSKPLGPVAR